MDLTKYYPDIAAKYPAYVTKRELCEICHICPKTAYNLEQQGEIPYTIEQNHLIRSHKIKLTDILAYLYRRECRQEADSPYTDVELRKNTDVNTGWLSSEPLTQYEYLTKLDGSKVAISVTIPTFAKGGSGKVEAGDIIMLFATDKDTGETTQPPELKYVEVLAATQSSGADKEYQVPQDDEEENPEESLPSTITLLVNTEQAQLLAHLEESNSLHLAFVYRGTRENAEKFLAAQDQFFVEPEEDTAAQDGEQGEVSDDNNVADNTGDNAAGNEPAEEQEVENTDGE